MTKKFLVRVYSDNVDFPSGIENFDYCILTIDMDLLRRRYELFKPIVGDKDFHSGRYDHTDIVAYKESQIPSILLDRMQENIFLELTEEDYGLFGLSDSEFVESLKSAGHLIDTIGGHLHIEEDGVLCTFYLDDDIFTESYESDLLSWSNLLE